jgi:hypothetical protein
VRAQLHGAFGVGAHMLKTARDGAHNVPVARVGRRVAVAPKVVVAQLLAQQRVLEKPHARVH